MQKQEVSVIDLALIGTSARSRVEKRLRVRKIK